MARYINAEEITYDRINGCYMARATDIDEIPTAEAIPLDKVKQARRELDKVPIYGAKFTDDFRIHLDREEVFSILDKLIEESEG